MIENKKQYTVLLIICFLLGFFLSQCSSDNNASGPALTENDTQTGDGGTFFPNGDGNTNVCEMDEEGNCIDAAENTEPVTLNTDTIDFGVSELGAIECRSVNVPAGLAFAAEIDKNSTSVITVEGEGNVTPFSFQNADGSYTQSRIEGTGAFLICYLRKAIGTHSGLIKVVMGGEDTASFYTYSIPLSGSTMDVLFTITSPTPNKIYYDCTGSTNPDCVTNHQGKDDNEGDYLINAEGNLNPNLFSILKDGVATPVMIEADSVKFKAAADESGHFKTMIGLPQTEGLFDITFSIETSKGATLTKAVPIVLAGRPRLEIEVRNTAGDQIDTANPTDALEMVVGFKIPNLEISGPDPDQNMAVELYDIRLNDEELAPNQVLRYIPGSAWCTDSSTGNKYTGFNGEVTICVRLDNITELQKGLNIITAKAKNLLGEVTSTLIVDNNKPTITITNPRENSLRKPGLDRITIQGTVENFAPLDAVTTAPAKASDSDKGSYCQQKSENDANCPASSLKLWFNTTTKNLPINIYPEYSQEYVSSDLATINNGILANPDTAHNCRKAPETGALVCNITKGKFSFTLDVPSENHHAKINLFTNIIQFQATSLSGHTSIKVVTFQTGLTNKHTVIATPKRKGLDAGPLGTVKNNHETCGDNCVARAPFMINLSEGILDRYSPQGKKIIPVVEKFLNENLSFADLANGWPLPENNDGEVDLLHKFKQQYRAETNKDFTFFAGLKNKYQERFIHQGIHKASMAEKLLSLQNYRVYSMLNGTCEPEENYLCFFEQFGDPEKEYNVAVDACGETITTAFVPLKDLQHVARAVLPDQDEYFLIPTSPEWPEIAGTDLDFDDWVEGKWHVDKLNLGENGRIDADLCLIPKDITVETCDDDVSAAKTPAFWGHFVSYNLIEGGLTGQQQFGDTNVGFEDPTMPYVWSVGKLRLKLNGVLSLKKTGPLDGDHWPDGSKGWTNYLDINGDEIISADIDVTDLAANAETNSIILEPFANCRDYYESEWKKYRGTDEFTDDMIPFGCNVDEDAPFANYPVILEKNSPRGHDIYTWLTDEGEDTFLLATVWRGVHDTFKKIIGCMDTEMVNPMIDEHKFPYPSWVWTDDPDSISFDFEWKDFNFAANIKNADLNIFNGGITARVPLTLGVDNVMTSHINPVIRSLTSFDNKSFTGKVFDMIATANEKGHLVRGFNNLDSDTYPLTAANPEKQAFAGLSVNIEEIINSALYLLFKKGPMKLLKDLEVEELEPTDNWTVGIDKVILARFDICNIASLLPSDIPNKGMLFSTIGSSFNHPATHLDIILDPKYPPTLSLNKIEGVEGTNATEIKLGLTNIQIGVKEFISDEATPDPNDYLRPDDQPEIVRLRLDGVLSLKAIYHPALQKLNLFVEDYPKQNIHVSVPEGHGGVTYNDVSIVQDVITAIIETGIFPKIQKEFSTAVDAAASIEINLPVVNVNGAHHISAERLVDAEVKVNMDAGENKKCDDDISLYSDEVGIAPPIAMAPRPMPVVFANFGGIKNQVDSLSEQGSFDNPFATANCDALYPDNAEEENLIGEALCDLGIKDIVINPTLIFDNDNGYIHMSAAIAVKLHEWLGGD
ncbi:MAG: hypothetical protein HQM16_13335 [Deltaproteobacteria bacterium]|nr:hypothetical protein [Deltaproteobacteria bacterium]